MLTNVRQGNLVQTMSELTRKEQIEKQAASLFTAKGYAASSMRDLAQVLGIEPASLYSHIKSKEEILHRICFRMADAFFEALKEIKDSNDGPDEQLKEAIGGHLKVIAGNGDDAAVFFHEWRHLSEPYLSVFLGMRSDYEQIFVTVIRNGIQKEVFKTVDPKLAAMTLLSAMNGIHRWYKVEGKLSMDQISDQIAELMIDGLRA